MNQRLIPFLVALMTTALVQAPACKVSESQTASLKDSCGGKKLDEIKQANDISPDCRSAIQDLLPRTENSLTDRIYVLGYRADAGGVTNLYASGLDASGVALNASDFAAATITVIVNGTTFTLSGSDFTVTPITGWDLSSLSLSLVTDYSGSMSSSDIETASALYTDLLNALPPGVEAETYVFSRFVTQRQSFTTDRTAQLASVAVDAKQARTSTALYDAIGTSATSLGARSAPVKIQITMTDGQENASETYTVEKIKTATTGGDVFPILVGTLFADISTLKNLAGSRGIYVYARGITDARTEVTKFVQSLSAAVRIQLTSTYAGATSVTLKAKGITATFP